MRLRCACPLPRTLSMAPTPHSRMLGLGSSCTQARCLVHASYARVRVSASHTRGPSRAWRRVAYGAGKYDHSHLVVSHDGGETWHHRGTAPAHTNEAAVAQLADREVLLNARVVGGSTTRQLHSSNDGGHRWRARWRPADLKQPNKSGCHAAMAASANTLFYSGPHSSRARRNLCLRRSDDRGRRWRHVVQLWPGPSGYSSIAWLGSPSRLKMGVLFEHGEHDHGARSSIENISFVTLHLVPPLTSVVS
jgi:hypothetical protein